MGQVITWILSLAGIFTEHPLTRTQGTQTATEFPKKQLATKKRGTQTKKLATKTCGSQTKKIPIRTCDRQTATEFLRQQTVTRTHGTQTDTEFTEIGTQTDTEFTEIRTQTATEFLRQQPVTRTHGTQTDTEFTEIRTQTDTKFTEIGTQTDTTKFTEIGTQPDTDFTEIGTQPDTDFTEIGTQPDTELTEIGTQSDTEFTEIGIPTNFDEAKLSLTETFNHGCNICALYTEKGAVGYCCICEQYLCYKCCIHHENISVCKHHKIVGKEEFELMNNVNSLFDMHMVPLLKTQLPWCISLPCKSQGCTHNVAVLLASFCLNDSKNVYFLIHSNLWYTCHSNEVSRDSIELRKIKKDAEYQLIKCVAEDNDKENKICKYFNHKKFKHIWELKYCDNTVYFQKAFTVTGDCYGVVPFDNGLAISLYIQTGFSLPDWQIQHVDFTGDIKRQIYHNADGKPLFKNAGHIASNCTEDILFVSDKLANTVIALDTKGNVIYKFTHDSMRCPQGIACDEENNVYVACKNQVIQIHALGNKSRIILNSASKNIVDLYYYKENRRLAVIEATNDVTIFTFPPN